MVEAEPEADADIMSDRREGREEVGMRSSIDLYLQLSGLGFGQLFRLRRCFAGACRTVKYPWWSWHTASFQDSEI